MSVLSLFMTTTSATSPLDSSAGTDPGHAVSDFLTVQSLTNFAAMTGAITAAWNALQRLLPQASSLWVPYLFALAFAGISILISLDALNKAGTSKKDAGAVLAAIFVAVINALVLAGAVVGTSVVTTTAP